MERRYSGVAALLLLALFPVGLLAADNGSDLATEKNIGIGYEGMLIGEFLQGVSVRGWWGRWGAEGNAMQASVDFGDDDDVSAWMLTSKIMFAPLVREHSKFYVGLEGGWGNVDAGTYGDDLDTWIIGPLFGAEYRFQELPELGFNWEVGYRWTSLNAADDDDDIDLSGIFIVLGVHYYFR
jgi:hypothetical protein